MTSADTADDVGGMFKVVSKSQKNSIDNIDCTRMLISSARDWSSEQVSLSIIGLVNRYVCL